jgi:hypothetical protein
MATIPSGTKFLGVNPALTNLTEKKGARLDSKTEYFSIEDIQDAAGGDSPLKGIQVKVTQEEILNPAGFIKSLVAGSAGKLLIPLSISAYRAGGTAYSLSNSVRLYLDNGGSSSSIGGVVDAAFTSTIPVSLILSITTNSNFSIIPGGSLKLASGSLGTPSALTGGTGDVFIFLMYAEVDTTV